MTRALLAALAAAALAAGCGGGAGDLMAIEVSGGFRPGVERLVVTGDGRGRCNGGKLQELPSDRVLDAREVERELEPLAKKATTFPGAAGGGLRHYLARTSEGTVQWVEGRAGLPAALPKAAALALQLERQLCR